VVGHVEGTVGSGEQPVPRNQGPWLLDVHPAIR